LRKAVSGLRAWLVQRVSAVYMLLFILFLLTHFIVDPPRSYLAWHDWIFSPAINAITSVFVVALLAHAWVGVRDVVMDYVHPIALRVLVLSSLVLYLTGLGAWVARILWLRQG
jgi:succinate dehydrogenase / fumarate reductase membrane anchor subunit